MDDVQNTLFHSKKETKNVVLCFPHPEEGNEVIQAIVFDVW